MNARQRYEHMYHRANELLQRPDLDRGRRAKLAEFVAHCNEVFSAMDALKDALASVEADSLTAINRERMELLNRQISRQH
jgi:hypothetical protein